MVIFRLLKTYVTGHEILQLRVLDWMKLFKMAPYIGNPALGLHSRGQQCHVGWCMAINGVMLIVFSDIPLGGKRECGLLSLVLVEHGAFSVHSQIVVTIVLKVVLYGQ